MNTITQIFGTQVRYYRKLKGISQEELAALSELHRTYIGAIERGERNVSLNNIEKISQALGIPIVALLTDTKDKKNEAN